MKRPRPEPPGGLPGTRKNFSNSPAWCSLGMPGPSSRDLEAELGGRRRRDGRARGRRGFDPRADDDAAAARARSAARCSSRLVKTSCRRSGSTNTSGSPGGTSATIVTSACAAALGERPAPDRPASRDQAAPVQIDLARFDARQVQQLVDDDLQALAVVARREQQVAPACP